MHSLLEAYKAYFENPSEETIAPLWFQIRRYDLKGLPQFYREVENLWRSTPECSTESLVFKTNGSSGRPDVNFPFGPFASMWHRLIEQKEKPTIFLADFFPKRTVKNLFNSELRHPDLANEVIHLYDFRESQVGAFFDLQHPDANDLLGLFLRDAVRCLGGIHLSGLARHWLVWCKVPAFINFVHEHAKDILSITTTEDYPFFDQSLFREHGIPVNNRMVDWHTGTSFFTCAFGNRHILPTFIQEKDKSINLLNLTNKKVMKPSDIIQIGPEVGRCDCGKIIYDTRFIAHQHRVFPHRGLEHICSTLPETLIGRYQSLQFCTDETRVRVAYIPFSDEPMPKEDQEAIRQLDPRNIHFLRNAYFQLVEKFPVFWTGQLEESRYAHQQVPFDHHHLSYNSLEVQQCFERLLHSRNIKDDQIRTWIGLPCPSFEKL